MGGSNGGGGSSQDAKHVLDSIGQKVHEEVKKDAEHYKKQLKGDLSQARFSDRSIVGTDDPCTFKYNELLGAKNERYPCTELGGKIGEKRFSDTLGGQCTDSKMRSGGEGACAPYRRLHLCHHNLEKMGTTKIDNTHKLLAEVCMAAKYEGGLIKTHYTGHQVTNPDSQLCTVLARSFADIGDIVRGKDLFLGNTYESAQREKLEKNLKDIFTQIYNDVTNDQTKKAEAEKRYNDTTNYFQLREDWWALNRETVWKAITCSEDLKNSSYFRATCGSSGETPTDDKCRCPKTSGVKPGKANDDVNIVPTYFDYVPQYLRWFDEWAEDFCRLRKHKLKDAKSKCRRGENGQHKYCDLNRYDCARTIRGKHDFFEDEDCKDCQYSCARFVKWIDNQKLEFLKQRKKYGTEISLKSRKKRDAVKSNYDGYEKKFYEQLRKKNEYVKVDGFLELLNNETTCTKNNDDEEGGQINFRNVNSGSAKNSDGSNKTFCRTKYCEACPWCGVEPNGQNGKWKAKDDDVCNPGNDYRKYKFTNIPILTGDKTKSDMVKKYKKFCNGNGGNGATSGATGAPGTANGGVGGARGGAANRTAPGTAKGGAPGGKGDNIRETWTCYYYKKNENNDGKGNNDDINFCVLQDGKQHTKDQKDKSYNAFFWDWVHDMLIDSIKWRNELGSCINNNTNDNTCRNNKKCNSDCGCFKEWIEQKRKEWDKIKDHFDTQDFVSNELLGKGLNHDFVLNYLLDKKELLKNIKDTHADAKEDEIKNIDKMLKETGVDASGSGDGGTGAKGKHNTKIDKFLQQEEQFAEKCKKTQDECQPKKPTKVKNPCYGNNTYDALAGKVAQILQGKAQTQLGQNKSSLEGDISLAEFKNGGQGSDLKGNICKIDKNHSNATGESKNPCNGKGVRFKIEEVWKNARENGTQIGVYLPPRRRHICTSNVEHLLPPKGGRFNDVPNNKATHSLLGDVLLAAKKEGEDIKTKLTKNDNRSSICRTMKYSFADIGDIVRGKDLWYHTDQTQLQGHLQIIFGKIKEEIKKKHPDIKGNDKYVKDNENKQLRSDWWEANRDQIWEAMKCATKNGNIQCGATPYDDYIPQRLRWMTEWAEWFCKAQSRLYDELLRDCGSCKGKGDGKCTQGNGECEKCTKACDNYKKVVGEWEEQWNNMLEQYLILYHLANTTGPHGIGAYSGYEKDKPVVAFLQELQKQNSGNNIYESAAGYIHQEARTRECLVQNEFCFKKNGSAGKENEKYAFKKPPPDYVEACKCKDRPQPSTPEGGPGVRSEDPPQSPPGATDPNDPHAGSGDEDEEDDEDGDVDEEEDEEDEEEGEEEEKTEGAAKEEKAEEDGSKEVEAAKDSGPQGPQGPKVDKVKPATTEKTVPTTTTTQDNAEKPCEIVDKLFNNPDNFKEVACTQKYSGNNSRLGWKCVTSANTSETTTDKSGGVCIPPRRRRLYVTPLTTWASGGNDTVVSGETTEGPTSQVNGDGDSESSVSGSTGVQIEAANSEAQTQTQGETSSQSGEKLRTAFIQSAAIETFFLWHRYKKEWEHRNKKSQNVLGGALLGEEPPKEENPQTSLQSGNIPPDFLRQMFYTLGDYRDICVGKTPDGIDKVSASGDNPTNEVTMKKISEKIKSVIEKSGSKPSGQTTKPEDWWNKYGKDIWEGMICALSYDTENITKDEDVHTKLMEEMKDNKKYNYKKVTISSIPISADKTSITTTNLSDFANRPTFFRWLEEWGETFCRERKSMLEKIKVECKVEEDKYKCSGDGHVCDKAYLNHNNIFEDPNCPGCYEQCRKYRKWIDIKFVEYHKQKDKYEGELDKLPNNSNGDYKKLKGYSTAAEFLKELKHCKNAEGDGSDPNNKINFENPLETFNPSTYCETCPPNKVNCNGGGKDPCAKVDAKGKSWEKVFNGIHKNNGNSENTTDITVEMIDRRGEFIKNYLKNSKNSFKTSPLFKGIRKQEWECRFNKAENKDVCYLKNFEEKIDLNKYTTFKVLLIYWLEDFLYGYYLLKKRKIIEKCTKKEGNTCSDEQSKKNCACVKEWIEKKRGEWEKIKDNFKHRKPDDGDTVVSKVRNFLETLIPRIAPTNDKGNVTKLSDLEKSLGCNCAGRAENSKEDEKEDVVECLLEKLKKKIESCPNLPSGDTEKNCDAYPTLPENEEENEEENEKTNIQPKFCPKPTEPEPKAQDEDGCKPAPPPP
ncbi:hypothetical protein PFMALIP_06023, partial [Plasmodium falciparum MaliPS096_E11]